MAGSPWKPLRPVELSANRTANPRSDGGGPDNVRLLRQVVHPLLAQMPEPRVEALGGFSPWKGFPCRPSAQPPPPPPVAGAVAAVRGLAELMAEDLSRSSATMWDALTVVCVPGTHPPEVVAAALSVALYLAGVEEPVFLVVRVARRRRRAVREALQEWQRRARLDADAPTWGALNARGGSYRWISQDSDPACRLERLAGAFTTLRQGARLRSVTALVRSTKLLTPLCQRPAPCCVRTVVWHSEGTVLEAALSRARQGFRVVAVSAASAYQVGGGFLSGGRHALEESICTQSTLFFSLLRAAQLAADRDLRDQQGTRVHIPEDGAILSPGVEVFRDGTEHGYPPCGQGRVWLEAIISVAMPNMNPSLADAPFDWRSKHERELLVERKFHAVLQGAAVVDAEVLVLPDVGCGIYGNHPTTIGSALGRVLYGYRCYFSEIVVTGDPRFFDAVCESAGSYYLVRRGQPRNDDLCEAACNIVQTSFGRSEASQLSRWWSRLGCCGWTLGLRKLGLSALGCAPPRPACWPGGSAGHRP